MSLLPDEASGVLSSSTPAKTVDAEGFADAERLGIHVSRNLATGGIIGVVDLVDIVRDHPSEWAEPGMWHWVLTNPGPVTFHPIRGQLYLCDAQIPGEVSLAHAHTPPAARCGEVGTQGDCRGSLPVVPELP
ncbi:MAG: hypothetical protein ACLP4R_14030 [Solirubrobacteraceae bacterium]